MKRDQAYLKRVISWEFRYIYTRVAQYVYIGIDEVGARMPQENACKMRLKLFYIYMYTYTQHISVFYKRKISATR